MTESRISGNFGACFLGAFVLESDPERTIELTSVSFRVPGAPVAWKRPRSGQAAGKQWRFTDPLVREWQDRVAAQWMVAGRPYFETELRAELCFVLPRGKSRRAYPRQDCDNLAKGTLDALNGLAYKDDSQITGLFITKQYGDEPGVNITLSE